MDIAKARIEKAARNGQQLELEATYATDTAGGD